jgi:hypothetical protein
MFEVIGILVAWLLGGAVLFNVAFRLLARDGEGFEGIMGGFWAGIALLAVYVIATVAYLAAT